MKLNVFLFPHNDDELFVVPQIVECKNLVPDRDMTKNFFIFLTRSLESEELSLRRQRESVQFLSLMGIAANEIIFLGSQLAVLDGTLIDHMERVENEIVRIVYRERSTSMHKVEFFSTAYEGGHHDHDAAALLTQILAARFQGVRNEYFLYHSRYRPGRLYQVASPFPEGHYRKLTYSLRDWTLLVKGLFIFKSQRKALLGLWPFLFVKSWFKPLTIRRSEFHEKSQIFHANIPMYERWKRTTQSEFLKKSLAFLSKSQRQLLIADVDIDHYSSFNSQDATLDLIMEIRHFHYSIFRFEAPSAFIRHYLELHRSKFMNLTIAESSFIKKIVDRRIGISLIELVSRRRYPVLSKKINSLIYIAEALDGYQNFFVASKSSRILGLLQLARSAASIPFIYVVGYLTGKWHGLF